MRDKHDPDYNSDGETDVSISSVDQMSEQISNNFNNNADKDKSDNKTDDNQSPLDYVIDKQASEMPDITESDGGD
jgi:hypothetical protein